MATQHTKFDRHSIRVWISWCEHTVDFFWDFCFEPKPFRVKMISRKNYILREIIMNCSSKVSLLHSYVLVIDHFWWTILDKFTQNIIFTPDIFDATRFCRETKIYELQKNPLWFAKLEAFKGLIRVLFTGQLSDDCCIFLLHLHHPNF